MEMTRRTALKLVPLAVLARGGETRAGEPMPIVTQIGRMEVGDRTVTAITRRWSEGDAAWCHRCPAGQCGAHLGSCTIMVPWSVADDDARDFRFPASQRMGGDWGRIRARCRPG